MRLVTTTFFRRRFKSFSSECVMKQWSYTASVCHLSCMSHDILLQLSLEWVVNDPRSTSPLYTLPCWDSKLFVSGHCIDRDSDKHSNALYFHRDEEYSLRRVRLLMRVFEHLRPFVKVIFDGFKRPKWVKCDPKSLKIIKCTSKTKRLWQFQAKKEMSTKLTNSNIDKPRTQRQTVSRDMQALH